MEDKKQKGDRLDRFEMPIIQYVRRGGKGRKRRVGVLFAGVLKDDPKRVAVGFSLCHSSKDEFDKAAKNCGCHIPQDGLGLRMAKSNALKWLNKTFVFTSEKNDPPPFDAFVKVPASLMHSKNPKHKPIFLQFVERVKKYYVNPEKHPELARVLPAWVTVDWEKDIEGMGVEETINVAKSCENTPT